MNYKLREVMQDWAVSVIERRGLEATEVMITELTDTIKREKVLILKHDHRVIGKKRFKYAAYYH